MKYLPLIWLGVWRKPARTTLILLQVAVAFALFGVLQGMKTGVDRVVANLPADLLYVLPSLDSASPLPVSYADRLRSIPGVKTVTFLNVLNGTYQRPSQQVSVIGLEKNDVWQTPFFPDLVTILPKDLRALQNTRTGVLMTAYSARKYGWRVGDRIPITSTTLQNDGSATWVFDIVGIATRNVKTSTNIFANYDYLDAARAVNKGTVVQFLVIVSDPRRATAVSAAIDRTFANSPNETMSAAD
jgi:putative ABC transport system permease protein